MNTTIHAPGGRGCGERSEGMPYVCCGLSPFGKPIESFVVDPAIPWPGKFQRGTKILPRNSKDPNSINDLVIFVGEQFYQSAWDFVEEVRRFGASRKVSPTLPFEKLSPGKSRMVFVHSKAIPNFIFTLQSEAPLPDCKLKNAPGWAEGDYAGMHPFVETETPCTFALRDLTSIIKYVIPTGTDYGFRVEMPSFCYEGQYLGYPHDHSEVTINWRIGVFLALPLTHIEYKKRPHKEADARAKKAGFDTVVMEH